MDLYINIKDENGKTFESVNIYQDGSDAEGAKEIREWLEDNYSTDPEKLEVCHNCGADCPNWPSCDKCGVTHDEGRPLKLSGGINWEARNDQIHDYNEAHKGLKKF